MGLNYFINHAVISGITSVVLAARFVQHSARIKGFEAKLTAKSNTKIVEVDTCRDSDNGLSGLVCNNSSDNDNVEVGNSDDGDDGEVDDDEDEKVSSD